MRDRKSVEFRFNVPLIRNELKILIVTFLVTIACVCFAEKIIRTGVIEKEKEQTIKLLTTARFLLLDLKNEMIVEKNGLLMIHNVAGWHEDTCSGSQLELVEEILLSPLLVNYVSDFTYNRLFLQINSLKQMSVFSDKFRFAECLLETILLLELEEEYQEGSLILSNLIVQFSLRQSKIELLLSTEN